MIKKYFKYLIEIIEKLDRKPIGELIEELVRLKERKGRLFILGVGGSAANASHAVNDFRKLANIEAYAPTDNVAELSARTNDDGFETIFAEWLKVSKLNKKDLLLVLSVGGGNKEKNVSVNLVTAIDHARRVKCKVAGIVGRDGGYVKEKGDICILIPTANPSLITPYVESFQAIIWHLLVFLPVINENQGKWESLK